jgi:hypothetical protein
MIMINRRGMSRMNFFDFDSTIVAIQIAFILILWIIPIFYTIQRMSVRIFFEVVLLFIPSLLLPLLVQMAEKELYGIAANFTLNDAMMVGVLQLILWLGGLNISLQQPKLCNFPSPLAARYQENQE